VRSPRRLTATLAVLAATLVACSGPSTPPPPVSEQTLRTIEADGGLIWEQQAAPLQLGVTHTRNSLDDSEYDEARARGTEILADDGTLWQNHHLMGFGTDNPEPAPGEYDWDSLDQRIELTEETRGRAMLTLCCAPDWMKGGTAGETDWNTLEDNPLPEFYDDYARLAAAAVERYPQVERVMVWNELKGFYNHAANRWDYEGYTEFYNQVYTAVKNVRPDIQVGGPYVVLTSLDPGSPDASDVSGPWGVVDQRALDVVDYWLARSVGADFLVVDGSTSTRQDTTPSPLDGAQKFADLTRWLQQRSDLPIWWAEFYPDVPSGEDGAADSPISAAVTLAAVAAYAQAGASGALLWGPQGHDLEYAALWTDATTPDGGRPTPLTAAWEWLVPRLADGEVEIGRSPTEPLLVFRAPDGAIVVNAGDDDVPISQNAGPVGAWVTTVIPRTT
jgi:hypothetical protein